jgi:hypothetical protein
MEGKPFLPDLCQRTICRWEWKIRQKYGTHLEVPREDATTKTSIFPVDRGNQKVDIGETQTGSLDPDIVLGGFRFPILSEGFGGRGETSERRTSGVHNVTIRETKRPKEREKDKEYRRLTLTSADVSFSQFQGRAEVHSSPRTFGGNGRETTQSHLGRAGDRDLWVHHFLVGKHGTRFLGIPPLQLTWFTRVKLFDIRCRKLCWSHSWSKKLQTSSVWIRKRFSCCCCRWPRRHWIGPVRLRAPLG